MVFFAGAAFLAGAADFAAGFLGAALVAVCHGTKSQYQMIRNRRRTAYLGGGSLLGCFLDSRGLLGRSGLLGRGRVLPATASQHHVPRFRTRATDLLVGNGSLRLLLQLDSTTASLGQVEETGLGSPRDGLVQVVEIGSGPDHVVLLGTVPDAGCQCK